MLHSWWFTNMVKVLWHPAIRPLVDYAEANGYRVSLLPHTHGDWAFGFLDSGQKLIAVYLRDAKGRFRSIPDVAFILAHEIRHMEHLRDKLFPSYYRSQKSAIYLTALAAERNCDLHARRYVRKHFPKHTSALMKRKYPGWRVTIDRLPEQQQAYRTFADLKTKLIQEEAS